MIQMALATCTGSLNGCGSGTGVAGYSMIHRNRSAGEWYEFVRDQITGPGGGCAVRRESDYAKNCLIIGGGVP